MCSELQLVVDLLVLVVVVVVLFLLSPSSPSLSLLLMLLGLKRDGSYLSYYGIAWHGMAWQGRARQGKAGTGHSSTRSSIYHDAAVHVTYCTVLYVRARSPAQEIDLASIRMRPGAGWLALHIALNISSHLNL